MAAVTVVSEAERESVVAIGVDAAKVHVVPNGADGADLDRPRTVATPPRLIYPGAITYAPNLEAVVWCLKQVMPRVREVRPDVELWVTGDTGDLPLDRMPNRDMVRFTGRLPDVKDAISGAAATVVPLLVGGGTRLKVLESMALGTPVVSTRRGVDGLAVEDGSHVLLGDTAEAFSAQVVRVLDDPELAARLSVEGRARIRADYTWQAIGQRLLARRGRRERRGTSVTQRDVSNAPLGPSIRLGLVGALACLTVATVPYLVGFLHAPEGRVYTGLMFDVPDHAQVPGRG